ncbi:alpha/beta fold hydrolase [Streptomyces sp. NPDC046881]|uniref:alpha/beta hydrolase n=1 Tax=Streptomyces sp. NPDC046881 TaxID=3155374 RepID=UPI0033FCC90A
MDELTAFSYPYDGERLSGVSAGPPGRATAVLLHGAGNGSKERLLPFVTDFADRGCRALAFDFSGHGESTGALAKLSLRRRFELAVAVLDAHAPAGDPLVLVGFSGGGPPARAKQSVGEGRPWRIWYGTTGAGWRRWACALPPCTRPRPGRSRSAPARAASPR